LLGGRAHVKMLRLRKSSDGRYRGCFTEEAGDAVTGIARTAEKVRDATSRRCCWGFAATAASEEVIDAIHDRRGKGRRDTVRRRLVSKEACGDGPRISNRSGSGRGRGQRW